MSYERKPHKKRCLVCGGLFVTRSALAQTCSARCRKIKSRRNISRYVPVEQSDFVTLKGEGSQ